MADTAKNAETKLHLPKCTKPTYVSIRSFTNNQQETLSYSPMLRHVQESVKPKKSNPIYVSVRRSATIEEELIKENGNSSLEEIVKVIEGNLLLEKQGNRKELLLIITNFLKQKQ